MKHFKNLKLKINLKMNSNEEEKLQNSRINSIENNRTLQAIQTKKKFLFYKKAFLKNNKSSFIYRKKGKNLSNITPNNKNSFILGYKKIPKNINNYGTEDTNQSTKGKTINYSKTKLSNNSKYDGSTPEKYILNDRNISPYSIESNEKSKENKNVHCILNNRKREPKIIKYDLNRKRANLSLNYASRIHNITINNDELKKNIKFEDSLEINNKTKITNSKHKKIKALKNIGSKAINISFKTNKNKESIDLLSHDIVQNIQNSLNKYNNYNNTNTIIINNTIKRNNSNFLRPNKLNKAKLTINNNVFDINNNYNIDTGKRKLVKGKIIKFKYNGTEFFFEPIHNKTESYFYKKNVNYNKEETIKAANSIKKWWRQMVLLNKLKEKNQIKYGTSLINKIILKRSFIFIKYKVIHLKEIIYLQKHWRKFLNYTKDKTNFYIKNDIYGCDNSYRKNINNNFNSNTYDCISSIENIKNEVYYKNNKLKKNNILLNNSFFANISNKNLLPSTNNNEFINKNILKNICLYSKSIYNNNLNKIIFIQRKIRKFLKNKYCHYIRMIYKNLYNDKLKSEINDINNKLKEERDNFLKGMNITYQSFDILSNKNEIKNLLYIIKNEEINYCGKKQRNQNQNNNLLIENSSQMIYYPRRIIKRRNELKISKNPFIKLISKKTHNINKIKKEINFSIKEKNKDNFLNSIINRPIINEHCFYNKFIIKGKYLKAFISIQKYFRKNKINKNKKIVPFKTIPKSNCLITKIYKNAVSNIPKITKTQDNNIIVKPIIDREFITKLRKKETKIKRIYKFKRNNSLKTMKQNEPKNNNQIYFNNIEEFLHDKDGEKINDVSKYNTINNSHRNISNERNSNLLNDTDENKHETPIRIMNAEIHKSSINYNLNNITNLKTMKNNYNLNKSNKYINIESLPSINSLRTNTENNELFALEKNKMTNSDKIKNNFTSVSIQTLGSNLSKNKFRENIKCIKTLATEGNNYQKSDLEYDNKNYFYTDNDIAKFSFNNGDINLLENSIIRANTINYFNLIRYVNERVIKIFCYKMKEINYKSCLYIFIQMVIQRIKRYIKTICFNIIFNRNIKNDFYKIIQKHIKLYNKIALDPNIQNKFKKNELIILIKENIFNRYFNIKSKFLFLSEQQENNFINKNIFISNDKDLINYFLLYYKYEFKPLDNSCLNMIQFRLIKEPLHNMNIFSITKYMEKLYYNIIHGNICKTCFCKKEESCSINCNCHIRQQNSINLINKIKNRITHYKINNENNKENNSYIEEKNNKYNDKNIRIIIKKVKRTSADKIKNKNDNSEQSSDSKNSTSNEYDIFQKMNAGIDSIINKFKINKAFKDFSLNKKKQIERTCTEFNGESKNKKAYNETSYIGSYNVKNHFTTPDKKSSSFLFEKKLFNEK